MVDREEEDDTSNETDNISERGINDEYYDNYSHSPSPSRHSKYDYNRNQNLHESEEEELKTPTNDGQNKVLRRYGFHRDEHNYDSER